MKKLKNKSLIGLAVLAMAGAGLVACGPKKDDEPKVKSPLEEAAYYIDQIYQSDEGKLKTADFDRISKYIDDQNREFTIDWSVTVVTSGAPATSVQVVPGKNKKGEDDANLSKIDIDEESELDVDFTLSGVIHYGEDSLNLATLNLKMPKLHIATWEEYVGACKKSGSSAGDSKNTALSVEGIVTAIIGAANGNTTNALYVQDVSGKGSYYAYKLADDPATKVQKGTKVRISGETGLYSGTYEILNPSITKVFDDTPAPVAAVDYTAKFAAATALTDAGLTDAQGLYVEIKDVEVTDEDLSNGYFNFKKGSLTSYVRISSSVCPISKDAQTKLKADHLAKRGWIADVKGIVNLFNGGFYLTPVDAEPFNFKSLPELSDTDQVAFEKNNLTLLANVEDSQEVTLKTAGSSYTGVNIAWSFKADTPHTTAVIDNGKVTFTCGEDEETVTLVATLTKGSATDTKEFVVKVDAASSDEFLPSVVSEAKVGTYKMVMEIGSFGNPLYATGTINSKGALETSDKAA
ncbi:MAG: hypothetical protein MJZ37_05605, partial [Bacilli bacterium]|nr:hypothetical protein [Bacilli bacterium]